MCISTTRILLRFNAFAAVFFDKNKYKETPLKHEFGFLLYYRSSVFRKFTVHFFQPLRISKNVCFLKVNLPPYTLPFRRIIM